MMMQFNPMFKKKEQIMYKLLIFTILINNASTFLFNIKPNWNRFYIKWCKIDKIAKKFMPNTCKLIENLPKLKYIMTSGMRNNAIDLEAAKNKNIIVCGTEINPNPAFPSL